MLNVGNVNLLLSVKKTVCEKFQISELYMKS